MAKIPARLMRAYRRTIYVVEPFGRGRGLRFVLHVGVRSRELDLFVGDSATTARTWVMITAYNPRSKKTPTPVNRNAHRRLKRALLRTGAEVSPGWGNDPDSPWREPMWFARGISRAEALELGRAFGQYAIVFGEVGGAPLLVACQP